MKNLSRKNVNNLDSLSIHFRQYCCCWGAEGEGIKREEKMKKIKDPYR